MTNETIQTSVSGEGSPELPVTAEIPATDAEHVASAELHASEVGSAVAGDESSDMAVAEAAVMSIQPVAETNAPPDIPPAASPSGGTGWTWPIVALAAVTALAWLGKKLKANTAAFEKSVEDELVESVLDAVAKDASDRAALRQELADVVANGGTLRTGPLTAILRIEDGYEKKSTGRYLRRISVLRRKEGTTSCLVKIESELGWEYIPEAVREQFIKMRQEKVVRLVYNVNGEGT